MKTKGKIAVFPVYRDNPYVNLLMLAARAEGREVVETTKLEELERAAGSLGAADVLHLHWTSPVVQRADTVEEATRRLDRFRAAVDGARDRGAVIVWTLHNVLPHDARHIELELELCRYLADAADVLHVMTAATVEAVAGSYPLDPAKVKVIPHPSYQGIYPSSMTRAEARASFDLADDDHAVLFFGQMRPYKGLDALLTAVASLTTPPVLLLAGRTAPDDLAAIEALLVRGARVRRLHDHVSDTEVERWFRAADLAVLPYRRILNSGTLHLAATFGLPTLLPDEKHLRAEFDGESWIRWFDADDAAPSIADALADPTAYSLPRDGAEAFARRLAPYRVSEMYADLVDDLVARSSTVA